MTRHGLVAGLCGALLLAIGQPARAADNLACATALIDEPLSAAVFATYRREGDMGAALIERAGEGFFDCAESGGWSDAATESALRVMFGEILTRGLAAEFVPLGVDVETLRASTEAFLAQLAPEARRGVANGEVSDDSGEALVYQLLNDKAVREDQLSGDIPRMIGEYAAARANAVVFTADFGTQ